VTPSTPQARGRRMGRRTAFGSVEPANHAKLFNRLHPFLLALRGRSSATYRCALLRAPCGGLC
jgi:hypothetical protein